MRFGKDSPLRPRCTASSGEGFVGRWAGPRRLWSIYKPRPKQNFFQAPSHLPGPQTKAKDWGGAGGRLHCPAEEELGLLPATWPPSPWNSKNIFRAERRDASLFIYPSFSTLLSLIILSERSTLMIPLLYSSFLCDLWNILSGTDLTGFNWKEILVQCCRSNFPFPTDF